MKLGVHDSPYNPLLCSSLPGACFDTCLSSRRGRVRQTRESLWVYSHGGTGLDGPPFVLHCTAHCRVLPAQQSGHVRYRTAGDLPVDMATFHHLSWHDHVECSRHLVLSWGRYRQDTTQHTKVRPGHKGCVSVQNLELRHDLVMFFALLCACMLCFLCHSFLHPRQ